MGRITLLTDSEKKAIRFLVSEGWTAESIAKHVGRAASTVRKFMFSKGLRTQRNRKRADMVEGRDVICPICQQKVVVDTKDGVLFDWCAVHGRVA